MREQYPRLVHMGGTKDIIMYMLVNPKVHFNSRIFDKLDHSNKCVMGIIHLETRRHDNKVVRKHECLLNKTKGNELGV